MVMLQHWEEGGTYQDGSPERAPLPTLPQPGAGMQGEHRNAASARSPRTPTADVKPPTSPFSYSQTAMVACGPVNMVKTCKLFQTSMRDELLLQ